MKSMTFYAIHRPNQLLMAGKGWEIRAHLRQLARTGLTVAEYLRRINEATAPDRSPRPKNTRNRRRRSGPSLSSHHRGKVLTLGSILPDR